MVFLAFLPICAMLFVVRPADMARVSRETCQTLGKLSRQACPHSSTDRVPVFGTEDGGSIPSEGTKTMSSARKSRTFCFVAPEGIEGRSWYTRRV